MDIYTKYCIFMQIMSEQLHRTAQRPWQQRLLDIQILHQQSMFDQEL
jgi:7,8-dihydro-6-hydroxymethylpterin-pyrophosphokinase